MPPISINYQNTLSPDPITHGVRASIYYFFVGELIQSSVHSNCGQHKHQKYLVHKTVNYFQDKNQTRSSMLQLISRYWMSELRPNERCDVLSKAGVSKYLFSLPIQLQPFRSLDFSGKALSKNQEESHLKFQPLYALEDQIRPCVFISSFL